ncbi:hypothetical protein [Sulfuritalea sp.]|uniref:hypothetical protein n=1 Tax=Sulfuritalea sp. TaxID=2480090 RepID=UPI00286E39F7|nr:hypothetical protein [Sulfuritalea sp.]
MKSSAASLAAALALLLLAGCASVPSGPSVMALPGTGKNFEQFRVDDAACRDYARYQTGGASADRAAVDAGVRRAAVGTVVGAVAGAAIGGRDAAGVGAGTGLLIGSMAGIGAAQSSAHGTQRNYDNAYIQCMYGKGQRVPVPAAQRSQWQSPVGRTAPPPGTGYPPPPGTAPPYPD